MSVSRKWSDFVFKRPIFILMCALLVTVFAVRATSQLQISTRLEALMPEAASSVRTLNTALRKTGSFASIQLVAQSEDPNVALEYLKVAKAEVDKLEWVSSSQYSEDISVIDEHKLLLLEPQKLLDIENEIEQNYPTVLAQQIQQRTGIPMTIELREPAIRGSSDAQINSEILNEIQSGLSQPLDAVRYFESEDKKTAILVVWPKQGRDGLSDAKAMVDSVNAIIAQIDQSQFSSSVRAGIAGRIKNKVAQYDAVVGDLKLGLLSSISLIILLLIVAFRSFVAIPLIIIPLVMGIIWTIGLTAITVGGLNLITIFLALILFGLGIDFGIHNFSRYKEARGGGSDVADALHTIIRRTGAASFVAALTTSAGFFALMLTEFRAFGEFGFIAGSGILLVFLTMYSVFPAMAVVFERYFGWSAAQEKKAPKPATKPMLGLHPKLILRLSIILVIASAFFVGDIAFEKNFKNLQAGRTPEHIWATDQMKHVFPDGHDRAIVVAETQEELVALEAYFRDKIEHDTETPTIAKISSILDFLPLLDDQERRLEIIERLRERADQFQDVDPEQYETVKRYLDIGSLMVDDLPVALQRTFVGTDAEPGYLMYVYNSVTMDDSDLARQFYDDAAQFQVNGKTYSAASEGFIFVEMIALMKADAVKAVALVIFTTALLVFFFIRTVKGSLIVLTPPLLGVFATLGFMGAFGPSLSIINMVVLPSLIGISVDNCIHIFHRFVNEGAAAENIKPIMRTTGKAAILTTLTTLIGFGGMVTASMGGLRSMGLLAIIGFIFCLIMTWGVLPALMHHYKKASPAQ